MFLCSLIEELCTIEENDKTGRNFNFGHECTILREKQKTLFGEFLFHQSRLQFLFTFIKNKLSKKNINTGILSRFLIVLKYKFSKF